MTTRTQAIVLLNQVIENVNPLTCESPQVNGQYLTLDEMRALIEKWETGKKLEISLTIKKDNYNPLYAELDYSAGECMFSLHSISENTEGVMNAIRALFDGDYSAE
jgi:hypothetical protein